jgi:hypothetical protein
LKLGTIRPAFFFAVVVFFCAVAYSVLEFVIKPDMRADRQRIHELEQQQRAQGR